MAVEGFSGALDNPACGPLEGKTMGRQNGHLVEVLDKVSDNQILKHHISNLGRLNWKRGISTMLQYQLEQNETSN